MSKILRAPRERLIKLNEVKYLTGKSRSSIYSAIQASPPSFPRPVKDGTSSRWLESLVIAWISDRAAAHQLAEGSK